MISVIDYGSGNLKAICNIYKQLNIPVQITKKPENIIKSSHLILPGVGSFDYVMNAINVSGLKHCINEAVLDLNIPILGICVGMQVMAMSSEEGTLEGFGWFDGIIKKIDIKNINSKPKIPHMGWNEIKIVDNEIFKNIDLQQGFYFLHSYHFEIKNSDQIIAKVFYGSDLVCTIRRNNIFGVQFHPEKSHNNGINIFKNFWNIKSC